MKLSVAGSSQLSPPLPLPPSFSILQLITLIRSLAVPPPARLSLTDGLFNWKWGRGAQPQSRETLLTKDIASEVCVDFCLAWYGKLMSQCHSQISTLLYAQVLPRAQSRSGQSFLEGQCPAGQQLAGKCLRALTHQDTRRKTATVHCLLHCMFLCAVLTFILTPILAGS